MPRPGAAIAILVAMAVGGLSPCHSTTAATASIQRPMSAWNRLLLNRHVVEGRKSLQVMVLAAADRMQEAARIVRDAGGLVIREEPAVGYLRVELPTERLVPAMSSPAIEAYQISSLSRGTWYRDAPQQTNAELLRSFEVSPPGGATPPHAVPDLPLLSPTDARATGYSADGDSGVGPWLRAHPTFDGRGVTIALLETAQPEWTSPVLRTARTVDGVEIPKVAGVLNTIRPPDRDETRVVLDPPVTVDTPWRRIENRTYILPAPGVYRFGMFRLPAGKGLTHEFPVARDEKTGLIFVDSDGDGDFRSEAAMDPAAAPLAIGELTLRYPQPAQLAFVVGSGKTPDYIHVYVARDSHQTMTASVSAGSRSDDEVAYGVAPGARILFVRVSSNAMAFHNLIEGYLEAAARPDVDILCDSQSVEPLPDTTSGFLALFMTRLVDTYQKPIVRGAGNILRLPGNVSGVGGALSVGGAASGATVAALEGFRSPRGLFVHPMTAGGPGLDGALKPDFLAPVERLSASTRIEGIDLGLPARHPRTRSGPGHEISCCTSASSPYAAGVVALLLSAAKQTHTPSPANALAWALKTGSRFLPDEPAYLQGNGVLDVEASWRLLQMHPDLPRVAVRAPIRHVLSGYSPSGDEGVGLFEHEGWIAPTVGSRQLYLRRESGPVGEQAFDLAWLGNDGTFEAPATITLPLGAERPLPVRIHARTPGAHSAILELRSRNTATVVHRIAATIIATAPPAASSHTVSFTDVLEPLRSRTHYVAVPESTSSLTIDFNVKEGSLRAAIIPASGLLQSYYAHVFPASTRVFPEGRYSIVQPSSGMGTWSIDVENTVAYFHPEDATIPDGSGAYSLSVRLLSATLAATTGRDGHIAADVTNTGAPLDAPALDVANGRLRTWHGTLATNGLPTLFDIDVPAEAKALSLQVRAPDGQGGLFELHLYDCSSGSCFSHEFRLPAEPSPAVRVSRPNSGRWVAAVNGGPSTVAGGFTLEELTIGTSVRYPGHGALPSGAHSHWGSLAAPEGNSLPERANGESVVVVQLVDEARERDATTHPWENRKTLPDLTNRRTPVASVVVRLRP